MMILRRKEIVAAALVMLIGMAGYINWNYQDTVKVKDGDSYIETGKKLGEAQYVVNSNISEELPETSEKPTEKTTEKTAADNPVKTEDYFISVPADRETARAKALDILNQTATNESFDKEIRKKAQEQILAIANNVQNENSIENIAKAKGYDNICVYISEDNVNITVQKDGFSDKDAAKIQDIATQHLKISPNKIKIVEVK